MKSSVINNIVLCGGHLSPSLAIAEELLNKKGYALHFLGRKESLEGDKAVSLEYRVIKSLNIPFYPIKTGRLQRSLSLNTVPSLLKFPIGFFQSLYFLLKIKPDIVVSFGGYVALPVCSAAWLLKIPIITHEQTTVMGLSNRIIGRMARVLCLSYKNTKNIPKNLNTFLTGLPVRKSIFAENKIANITRFGNEHDPLIYVTGGSTGARSINNAISGIIPKLISKYRIIHQCGSADDQKDYKELLKVKEKLVTNFRNNYQLFTHIDPGQIGNIFRETILVISRAGANTVSEIAVFKKPSVLIPLPWAADDEQNENAKILEKIGAAIVIDQSKLTPVLLYEKIDYAIRNIKTLKSSFEKNESAIQLNAPEIIVGLIQKTINETS